MPSGKRLTKCLMRLTSQDGKEEACQNRKHSSGLAPVRTVVVRKMKPVVETVHQRCAEM